MTQGDAVHEAMKASGGYATLGQLYRAVLLVPGVKWGTKTPFASIRRIVQMDGRFFKIRPGLWALKSEEAQIFEQFGLQDTKKPEQIAAFDHSYYQGLLVELGNLQQFQTFVPRQDANRRFLGRTLADVSSLHDFPQFTYDQVLRRGRTIDVSWFNERGFPGAFYEVEHSTDIYNSLLKFVEFQDFRVRLCIVADRARRSEFEDKMRYAAFKPISAGVEFLDYERLSNLHTRHAELVALQSG